MMLRFRLAPCVMRDIPDDMSDDTHPRSEEPPTQDRVIADALIEDIVEWRITPGSWIREREIAARFGVSHAPVREAFRHVANIGFIQVVPWRGAHVIEIDRHAAIEVLELWKAMFGVVCRLAATAMSDADGVELLRRLDRYRALVHETSDTFEHLAMSNRVGAFIARRCGGLLATDMLDRIALFARWQHHVIAANYFSPDAGRKSAVPVRCARRAYRGAAARCGGCRGARLARPFAGTLRRPARRLSRCAAQEFETGPQGIKAR